jgi:hypothetical protein
MNKFLIIAMFALLPFQAFSEQYYIACTAAEANQLIKGIQDGGGIIKNVQTTKINDYFVSYTISYLTGSNLKALYSIDYSPSNH